MAEIEHQLGLADQPPETSRAWWREYVQLAKLRLNALVLATTLFGYCLASGDLHDVGRVICVMVGSALAAIGASALNQYLERDADRLMDRTADRPLSAKRLGNRQALLFGVFCVIAGVLLLAVRVNLLAGFLCALTAAAYLFVYTPLKFKAPVSTLAGAVPGALPPLIGWAGAQGELSVTAWVLFSILYSWQLPHFFAIAWIYREDYRRAGMPMISLVDSDGLRTGLQIVMCCLTLLFVSLLPTAVGAAGTVYFFAALLLGLVFLGLGLRFAAQRNRSRARAVLYGSLIYLPCLLSVWLFDHIPL